MYLQWALVALGAFLCVITLARLWHRHIGPRKSADGMPVMAAACGTVASLYVLTIAFLIVSASSSLSDARTEAEAEAGSLRDAYMAAQYFPAEDRENLQASLRAYTNTVITKEWPALSRQDSAPEAWQQLDALQARTSAATGAPAQVQADLHNALHDVYTQRRLRVAAAADSIPGLLLGFLIATAVTVPVFFLLMGWPPGARPTAGLGLVAVLFASGIWIVLQLNHPYSSGMRIAPQSFQDALVRMDQIDDHHRAAP